MDGFDEDLIDNSDPRAGEFVAGTLEFGSDTACVGVDDQDSLARPHIWGFSKDVIEMLSATVSAPKRQ